MHNFKTFEELSHVLHNEKFDCMEHLIDNIEELDEFQRGYWKGKYQAYDAMYHDIHRKLKHGAIDGLDDSYDSSDPNDHEEG